MLGRRGSYLRGHLIIHIPANRAGERWLEINAPVVTFPLLRVAFKTTIIAPARSPHVLPSLLVLVAPAV